MPKLLNLNFIIFVSTIMCVASAHADSFIPNHAHKVIERSCKVQEDTSLCKPIFRTPFKCIPCDKDDAENCTKVGGWFKETSPGSDRWIQVNEGDWCKDYAKTCECRAVDPPQNGDEKTSQTKGAKQDRSSDDDSFVSGF